MKTAICPGSFDPITLGHLDIIQRAAALFDRVVVVVMNNGAKEHSLFTVDERVELIRRCIKNDNIEVDDYDGLLVDYARKSGAAAIVKGLRAMSDFDYEFQQALTNKSLYPELETVFLINQNRDRGSKNIEPEGFYICEFCLKCHLNQIK